METVSENFKRAIKSDTREIKGYIEIVYDDKNGRDYDLSFSPDRLRNSLSTEIVDGIRKNNKYASLEENYTELDGSFILPNYNLKGKKTGYVSEKIFNDIEKPIFELVCTNEKYITSSGVTIYFDNNIAQIFNIKITKSDNTIEVIKVVDNDKNIYQNIFEKPMVIKGLQIDILQMEYSNRRIRISEIDFGVSQVYEGNDLVSFTIDEEIDLLLTNTPINDCKINLNNYDNMFDPINPKGLAKYLTGNAIIKPYIGVLTEENGIEYISMGYFYLKDWSSNTDKNVTLNGQSLMARLSNLSLISDGTFLYNNNKPWTSSTLSKYLTDIYGYTFDLKIGTAYNDYLKRTELLSYLQTIFSFMTTSSTQRKFYISRDNKVVFDYINFNSVDNISRKELIEDIKYESKTVLNKIKIKDIDNYSMTSSTKEDVLNQSYTLTSSEEYVWFTFNKRIARQNNDQVFSCSNNGNGKAELIDYNDWLAYIKFTGNIGDVITVHLNGYVFDNAPVIELVVENDIPIGDTLLLDFTEYFDAKNDVLKSCANFYLNIDKKHQITGNYVGDPSYTPGDVITVETKFGYKNMIMTKHSLTFDGGLSGTFEGMGD